VNEIIDKFPSIAEDSKLNKAEDCVEEWDFIFVLRVENVHAY
jgi:hypothetical protein